MAAKKAKVPTDAASRKGWALRREVLGEEFHDRSVERYENSELWRPMLDLASRTCWGDVWQRPGLTHRERALINIAMMSALRLHHETRVFVRGAVRAGATMEEIRETLLQVAIYCGFPMAVNAFRIAREVLDEPAIAARATANGRQAKKGRRS